MKYLNFPSCYIYILLALLLTSCTDPVTTKTNTEIPSLLMTSPVTYISASTATCGGVITSDGGFSVTARGVCWSVNPNPSITDAKTTDGAGIGSFTSSLTDLTPSTKYFVRAYATTTNSTTYGSSYQITTSDAVAASLSTASVSSISKTTATCGGFISSDGGSKVTERGVCWSTTQYPTISNSKTSDGVGTGSFASSLTGLTEGVSYYVRAYATNTAGTTYGSQVSFNTLSNPVVVTGPNISDYDGNVYHTVTIGTQTWMVENLKSTSYKDGTAIPNVTDNTTWSNLTTPAYCWNNNDISNKTTYGALYNCYTVNTGKLAPTGWHVATDAEWTILTSYISSHLGNSLNTAKALTATTNWTYSSSVGAIGNDLTNNNSSSFSALPGGCRINGSFSSVSSSAYWWSSSDASTSYAYCRSLNYSSSNIGSSYYTKTFGYSVRCVKD